MTDGFGRRFEDTFDPFEPRDERRHDEERGGPDETGVEDVRAQLAPERDLPLEEEPQALRPPEPDPEPTREPEPAERPAAEPADRAVAEPADRAVAEPAPAPDPLAEPEPTREHAPGHLEIPEGVGAFIGTPNGERRSVGIAIARFNGDITTRLLRGALETLEAAGVARSNVDVMQVPGAFELPLAAMALAKTRRYACVLALGCVIRGDTPHFDYVAGESASGVQLAGLETGIPVAFGVLTCDDRAQAEARAGGASGNKGAEAAVTALEMADVLARLRAETAAAAPAAARAR